MPIYHDRNNYKVRELEKVNELNLFWFEVNEMRQAETGAAPSVILRNDMQHTFTYLFHRFSLACD